MIPRAQYKTIKHKIATNKLLLLTGPREVGKQTIVQEILTASGYAYMELNGQKRAIKKCLKL